MLMEFKLNLHENALNLECVHYGVIYLWDKYPHKREKSQISLNRLKYVAGFMFMIRKINVGHFYLFFYF